MACCLLNYLREIIEKIMEIFLTICIYAGIVQGFYLAFLLHHNKRRNVANNYLSMLLVAMSINIAHSVFLIPLFNKLHNLPFQIKEPFLMLVVPFIWFYVKKMEQPKFRFGIQSCFHFLPFVVFMSVSIPAFLHGDSSLFARFLSRYSICFYASIWAVLLVQYSIYLVQILKITRRYKATAEEELSNIEYVDVSWLNTFLYAFILVFVFLAIMFVGAIHQFNTCWISRMVSLVFSVTIFYLGYKGLFQQSIFSNTKSIEQADVEKPLVAKPKLVDTGLTRVLLEYMEKNKPHHDAELTLTSLASRVGMGRNQLSEVINNEIGCNFYDFVNKYRVEDVKLLMVDKRYDDFTILAIAYEAGFPSKSTFNSIFKKHTGLTPSQYRLSPKI